MDCLRIFNPLETGRFQFLTGGWRGFKNEAGKPVGSHQMSKSARDAYDEAREKYRKNGEQKDLDEMKKIAEEQHKIRKDNDAKKAEDRQAKQAVNSQSSLSSTLKTEESSIRNNNFETGVVVGPNGEIILKKRGEFRSVTFTYEEVRKMEGAVVTHNHPIADNLNTIGHSLSLPDLQVLSMGKAAEMRAVTGKVEYSMSLRSGARSAIASGKTMASRQSSVTRLHKKAEETYRQKLRKIYEAEGADAPAVRDIFIHQHHLINREYAKASKGVATYKVTGDSGSLADLARIEQTYDGI